MRVAVAGGGPAGLYFARLLKSARPSCEIDVFELGPEGATWGFGVGLGGRSMKEISSFDQPLHRSLLDAMVFGDGTQNIHLNGENYRIRYNETMGAIARLTLLEILTAACRECGVAVHYNHRVDSASDLIGYDLVVAADGINSVLRKERELEFGTQIHVLDNHFAWYGVQRAMVPPALVFKTVSGGRFVGHYYAYKPDMSTFVAECDRDTWHQFGFEEMTASTRKAEMEKIFADELDGHPLVENRSIWRQFPAVTNERWFVGNLVLLGDNLRSAHFSIGSGTRLAMEDAAALFSALLECDLEIDRALPRFVELRKPARGIFGAAAMMSFNWYEEMAKYMDLPILEFIHKFLTRTGRITEERLQLYAPEFYANYLHSRAGVRTESV
jgi:2-polyprenyl-6-methoxyphenol hydroxylase-like FAD-dependent oxidoreductase